MHIVVAMKQIPDLQQIRIRDRQPILDEVPLTFGDIDKTALEAAVQIKEQQEAKVTALCVGSSQLEDTVKEALAIGADEAMIVEWNEALESSQSAQMIAAAINRTEGADLLLLGEGSGDNYSSQVGSRVAQLLGWPQVSYVSRIAIQDGKAFVSRSLEDCTQQLEVQLPAVIAVNSDLSEVRLPSVTQILKAGKKPRNTMAFSELGIPQPEPLTEVVANLAPESSRKQIEVKTVEALIQALQDEGFGGRG